MQKTSNFIDLFAWLQTATRKKNEWQSERGKGHHLASQPLPASLHSHSPDQSNQWKGRLRFWRLKQGQSRSRVVCPLFLKELRKWVVPEFADLVLALLGSRAVQQKIARGTKWGVREMKLIAKSKEHFARIGKSSWNIIPRRAYQLNPWLGHVVNKENNEREEQWEQGKKEFSKSTWRPKRDMRRDEMRVGE